MAGNPISRRMVLSYSVGIAAATYAGLATKQRNELRTTGPGDPAPRPAGFPEPRVLSAAEGELRVAPTARSGIVDLGAPRPVQDRKSVV